MASLGSATLVTPPAVQVTGTYAVVYLTGPTGSVVPTTGITWPR